MNDMTTLTYPHIATTPLTPAIGAEVSGIDLSRPLDEATFQAIRQLCLERCVLLFRGQSIDPVTHVAFTRRCGEALVIPYLKPLHHPGHPEIVVVPNMGKANTLTEQWHSESSFLPNPPCYTVLAAKELPSVGGDTMFANQYLAYDTLSPTLRELIAGLRAWHRGVRPGSAAAAQGATGPQTCHPVVLTHPDTGRKALFVNRAYTFCFDGMTEAESRGLLEYLLEHSSRPEFTYRHRWAAGDVLMWDNRSAIHYAIHDHGDATRVMHRTITGVAQ
jgi:taurine dioxygenase